MINLIAHRGNNNHKFIPNTKKAILGALDKEYIDGVEIDVRITKDNKLVLFHDIGIFINNSFYLIKELTSLELNKKTKIESLDSILLSIKSSKKIIIDIKYEGRNYKEIADIIYLALNNYIHLNLYISSFNSKLIKYLKKKYPDLKCGVIVSRWFNKYHLFNTLDFNMIRFNIITSINKNKETFIWTVNNPVILKKITKKFKDKTINIITDVAYLLK